MEKVKTSLTLGKQIWKDFQKKALEAAMTMWVRTRKKSVTTERPPPTPKESEG